LHRALEFPLADGRLLLVRPHGLPLRVIWHVGLMLLVAAVVVGLAALPVVARLTKHLERLRDGVERWGGGDLAARVPVAGRDEIAAVAATFNRAAERISSLLAAHKALLANASHELRSPLARLRVAIELWEQAPNEERQAEIERNLRELDLLIEEILLASRLDHPGTVERRELVELLALTAEEAARGGASADGEEVEILGDPRLLRRMVRNLIDNANRHGAPPVELTVIREAGGAAEVIVADHGPGIRPEEREPIFTPFHRPAGREEAAGGWGLGLSLVRQIARQHGGDVRCEGRDGGGSRFVVHLSAA
jgi:signal transduction histidine kinase